MSPIPVEDIRAMDSPSSLEVVLSIEGFNESIYVTRIPLNVGSWVARDIRRAIDEARVIILRAIAGDLIEGVGWVATETETEKAQRAY